MSEFSNFGGVYEGLCAVQDSNTKRWGFVDIDKNWAISPQFQRVSYFRNGLCAVNTVDGESVLIDRNGNTVFKCSKYLNYNIDSDEFYLHKHGKYWMIFETMNFNYSKDYRITLIDNRYQPITANNINLRTFAKTKQSPEISKTFFWEENQDRVFNYKGSDISDKLISEGISLSPEMLANNKYIIGQTDTKTKCFDVDGNKIAEFDNDKYYIYGDMLISDNKICNISKNKVIFENDNMPDITIQTYYNKYFIVKKLNGTSALYSSDGKNLVEFGKWDNIYPSSISNRIVVSVMNKYAVADYEGNLLLPLKYEYNTYDPTYFDGRYAYLKCDNKNVYIDMVSLNQYECSPNMNFENSYNYSSEHNSCIFLDKTLNPVYTSVKDEYFPVKKNNPYITIKNGVLLVFDNGITVNIDNAKLAFDVLPIIQNGRTLVPMRTIFEALGADVEWNSDTQTITAKNNDIAIQMQIGNNTLQKNGQNIQMDVSPQIIDGRTMVPVRAISDCFNVMVDWDGYSQTVSLFTN